MTYPLSLVNVLTVIAAAACLWAAVPEAQGKPQKLWRLAVPPFLATLVALVLLAGAVTSFTHDATWAATALAGTVGGFDPRPLDRRADRPGMGRGAPAAGV